MIAAEFCSIESEMQRVNRPLHFAKCAQKLTVKPGGKLFPGSVSIVGVELSKK